MQGWGLIAALRRRRSVIGAFAALGMALNLLAAGLVAAPSTGAASESIDAFLAAHHCVPDLGTSDQNGSGKPANHVPDCPLCGSSCPMGGCAPVNTAFAFVRPIQPPLIVAKVVYLPESSVRPNCALYPSDAVSQAPPRAA